MNIDPNDFFADDVQRQAEADARGREQAARLAIIAPIQAAWEKMRDADCLHPMMENDVSVEIKKAAGLINALASAIRESGIDPLPHIAMEDDRDHKALTILRAARQKPNGTAKYLEAAHRVKSYGPIVARLKGRLCERADNAFARYVRTGGFEREAEPMTMDLAPVLAKKPRIDPNEERDEWIREQKGSQSQIAKSLKQRIAAECSHWKVVGPKQIGHIRRAAKNG